MENFLDKLLNYYHLTYDEYSTLTQEPSFDLLPSPYNFKDMDSLIKYLNEKMNQNAKILIYGDYDCDGVMSTSILFNSFAKKGYKVGYYVPDLGIRRQFMPKETKEITFEELQKLSYLEGGH